LNTTYITQSDLRVGQYGFLINVEEPSGGSRDTLMRDPLHIRGHPRLYGSADDGRVALGLWRVVRLVPEWQNCAMLRHVDEPRELLDAMEELGHSEWYRAPCFADKTRGQWS